jgi:hypothetical protein
LRHAKRAPHLHATNTNPVLGFAGAHTSGIFALVHRDMRRGARHMARRRVAGWSSTRRKHSKVRPLRAGVHGNSNLGGGDGNLQANTARRQTWANTAVSSQLRPRRDGRPMQCWGAIHSTQVARFGKGRQHHSPRVDGGVVAGLVQGYTAARKRW